jgi:hypothetical protein
VLEVSASSYHARLTRAPSQRARARARPLRRGAGGVLEKVPDLWRESALSASRRATAWLVSLGRLKRVGRQLGLRCVQRKRRLRVAATDLVARALVQVVSARRPAEGLIHESDRVVASIAATSIRRCCTAMGCESR